MKIEFTVCGVPAPQGSKSSFWNPKAGKIVSKESSKKVQPWRQAVAYAAMEARAGITLKPPVSFTATFFFKRPASHYFPVNSRHNGELKPSAPRYVVTTPDMDKVLRSTWDALKESGVIHDDSHIALSTESKIYSKEGWTGAEIEIWEIEEARG